MAAARAKKKRERAAREHMLDQETDRLFEKYDTSKSGLMEKEELRTMLMAIEQEKGQPTLVSDAGLEKLLDRMLKNYGEEGPEGLGVSRENALTAMKRYRAWLKHEEMIERLFRQADANDSRTLERGGEIKVFLTLIVNEFPELRGVTVEDSDVDFILERCDGFSNGVKNEVIDMEEAGPAVATWIQVVRAKVRPSRRLRATPHRCTSSH